MEVLVTGGCGNIGRVVVRTLIEAGHRVRVLDMREPEDPEVGFIVGSVNDPDVVDAAVQGVDAVVHLAAIPAYRAETPPADYMRVNVEGTFRVADAAGRRGVPRLVMASSDSALGFVFASHPFDPDYLPIDENHVLRPQDPYGLSKMLGEEICAAASRRYDMKTVCLRFCWVWFEDTYSARAAIQADDAMTLRRTLWGHVHVRDAAEACLRAIECPSPPQHGRFYITAADTFADAPSLELIQACYPGVARVDRAYFDSARKTLFDTGPARKVLGWVPRHYAAQ